FDQHLFPFVVHRPYSLPRPREIPRPVGVAGPGECPPSVDTGGSKLQVDNTCQPAVDMNTLNKLLDKSAELCGSDSGTARKMRVSRHAVSKLRHGGKIDSEHLARLLDITQQDAAL